MLTLLLLVDLALAEEPNTTAPDPASESPAPSAPEGAAPEAPASPAPPPAAPEASAPAAPPAPVTPAPAAQGGTPAPAPATPTATEASPAPAVAAKAEGEVYVSSVPAGAQIAVDGTQTGQVTPAMLRLPAGEHTITAATACGRGATKVDIRAGLISRSELTLEQGPGVVDVRSEPAGAQVVLDGEPLGVTPLRREGVDCGPHDLLIQGEGLADFRQRVEVRAFDTLVVETTLVQQAFGTLVVAPTPLDAAIWLDGVDRGFGPMTLERVPVGPHELRVSAADHRDNTQAITVEKDAVLRLDVALDPKSTFPWVRTSANAGVTLAGAGLVYTGLYNLREAKKAYEIHLTVQSPEEAQRLYDEEVVPRYRLARIELISAGVLLAGGGVLWATTDFAVTAGPGTITAHRRW
jgi:hypothetical protein